MLNCVYVLRREAQHRHNACVESPGAGALAGPGRDALHAEIVFFGEFSPALSWLHIGLLSGVLSACGVTDFSDIRPQSLDLRRCVSPVLDRVTVLLWPGFPTFSFVRVVSPVRFCFDPVMTVNAV